MKYKVGDQIVYGNTGVCIIRDIAAAENIGQDSGRLYYVLKPLDQECVIYTPIDTKVFMRPVISAAEAERLIDGIPAIRAEAYYSNHAQELVQYYESFLKTHNCAHIIELAMSLYLKKQIAQQNNRKFGMVDERFMKQAEEILYGEFSLALGIPKDRVQGYIASRVGEI